jgi:hypothetical protein
MNRLGFRNNWLSLRNNQLNFKSSGKVLIYLEEIFETYIKLIKEKREITVVNCLTWKDWDFDQLCPKISPDVGQLESSPIFYFFYFVEIRSDCKTNKNMKKESEHQQLRDCKTAPTSHFTPYQIVKT